MSMLIRKKCFESFHKFFRLHLPCTQKSVSTFQQNIYIKNYNSFTLTSLDFTLPFNGFHTNLYLDTKRFFSKKKKASKIDTKQDQDSDDEEDEDEQDDIESDNISDSIQTVNVPSLRLDTVMKYSLRTSKKKIEKDFYATNLRINGQKALKKAISVQAGDEVDLVKGYSPDNDNLLLVDRVVLKSIGKVTGSGKYPLTIEVLKSLTVENYSDPWFKSSSAGNESEWKKS